MRVVIDTGIFVSTLIHRRGTIGAILRASRDRRFTAIYTTDILVEIIEVLGRDKFRLKYHIEPGDVSALIHLIRLRGELVIPTQKVTAYRHSKDIKFLEAALAGQADCIVSSDADLLDMGSFEGMPIMRPAEFLARF